MEVVELREEVGRLRRALIEERDIRKSQVAALWLAIENLQREAKRRATVEPADPQTTANESDDPQRTPSDADRTMKRSVTDAVTQTDDESKTGESANIYHLEYDQLKHVLGFLECRQLIMARRVCKRWRTVIDGVLDDFRKTHGCDLKKDSLPKTDMHLLMILRGNTAITGLLAPEQGNVDLDIAANVCTNLEQADLSGFTCRPESIGKLARQNRKLLGVTLPAGCPEENIEALLHHSTALESLTVDSPDGTGQWLRLLPQSIQTLEISGLEVPLEQLLSPAGLDGLRTLILRSCSGVTDHTLASLPGLAHGVNKLLIDDCPGVTAVGLQQLQKLAKLEVLDLLSMLDGVATNGMLDSLHGCLGLVELALRDVERPEAAIPAAAVGALAAACGNLSNLYVHTTTAHSQAALDALLQAD